MSISHSTRRMALLMIVTVAGFIFISGIIDAILKESLDECADRLSNEDGYPYISGLKGAQINFEEVLSNRRCLNVLDELDKLRNSERDAKCKAIFDAMMERHTKAVRKAIQHKKDPSSPKNSTSIRGTVLGVSAALLAEARYATAATFTDSLDKVEAFRDEIEAALGSHPQWREQGFAHVLSGYCTPDDRFLLNALKVYSERGDVAIFEKFERECEGLEKSTVAVRPWNAEPLWFDLARRGILIGSSRDETIYELYNWPGLFDFDHKAHLQRLARLRGILSLTNPRP
jgi:hypothetical protein